MNKLIMLAVAASIGCTTAQVVAAPALTASWIQKSSIQGYPAGPGPRGWMKMAYDQAAQKIFLIGGSGDQYYNDIWHYSLSTDKWTLIEPHANCSVVNVAFTPPSGRDEQTVEYDAYNNKYWMLGGTGYKCIKPVGTAAAGTSSTQIVDPTLPNAPANYYKDFTVDVGGIKTYVTAFDPATKTLTLSTAISGLASGVKYTYYAQSGSNTWKYDLATKQWSSFEGPHWGNLAPSPFPRLSPATAYSSKDKKIVLFSGNFSNNDTWALDVVTQTWSRKLANATTSPPPLGQLSSSMVYDSVNDVFVLYGGTCMVNAPTCKYGYYKPIDETWVYRLSTNTWQKMNPLTNPGPRQQHVMYYDSDNGVVVLHGGDSGNGLKNDTWIYEYSSNSWVNVTPATSPAPTRLAAIAYDPVARQGFLYGGVDANRGDVRATWALRLVAAGTPNIGPVAAASVNTTTGLTSTTFLFSSSGSNDPDGTVVSYLWNFGDGTSSTAASPSKTYSAAGSYVATLTVTDNQGATGSQSITMTVNAPIPAPTVSLQSVTLQGTVSDNTVSQITVNGATVSVVGGAFSAPVTISGATTNVNIQAVGVGGTTNKTVTISAP